MQDVPTNEHSTMSKLRGTPMRFVLIRCRPPRFWNIILSTLLTYVRWMLLTDDTKRLVYPLV